MQNIASWIFFSLFVIFAIVYVIKHKRNVNLLTKEENDRMKEGLSQAMSKELKYIWIIIAGFVGLIILEKMSILPNFFFSIVLLCVVAYGFYRNMRIYRKVDLPIKFIKTELFLGIIFCLFFSIFTCVTIFEYKQ